MDFSLLAEIIAHVYPDAEPWQLKRLTQIETFPKVRKFDKPYVLHWYWGNDMPFMKWL